MSFYKKVTRGLATPLQGSINLFSGSPNVSGDEGTDADNENPEHRTTYHSLSGRVNHDDDDEDVAKLEDIVGFFTGLLNTTTVCAGLGSLNNLKKHYLDEFIKKSALNPLRPQNYGPETSSKLNNNSIEELLNNGDTSLEKVRKMSLYDFDEHTSDSEEEDSADEEEELIAENLKPGKSGKARNHPRDSRTTATLITTQITRTRTATATTATPTPTPTSSVDTDVTDVTEPIGKVTTEIPEEQLQGLNPLQKSVVKNLDPHHVREGVLIKVKNSETPLKNDRQELLEKIQLRLKIADKLQRVFDLSDEDTFCGNYSAWLIKDVLLQGHVYLTKDALLYFAFLPKRFSLENSSEVLDEDNSSSIVYSGNLGLKSAKYGEVVLNTVLQHRYWAVLRAETLSIYSSSTNLYFPVLVIDIKKCLYTEIIDKEKLNREAISPVNRGTYSPNGGLSGTATPRASTLENTASELNSMLSGDSYSPTEDNVETTASTVWFKLVTKKKTYKFSCDSSFSARQWCNNITKLIFQHNNANSNGEVLIKIPISKIAEYNKRALFSEEEEEDRTLDATMNDIPLNVTIKYLGDNDNERKRDKLKRKYKGEEPTIEEVHFLFPKSGVEFFETFDKLVNPVVLDNDNQSSKSSITSTNFSEKAISTLSKSPNHLVQTVLDFNKPVDDDISAFKKFGTTITSPTRIFKATITSPEMTSIDETSLRDSFDSDRLHLPRDMSERALKNLEVSFVTSLKKLEDASKRYEKPHMEHSQTNLASILSDPSEVKKESKTAILKSIKALYSVGTHWSATPNHYFELGKYYVNKVQERDSSQRNFQSHFSTNSKLLASYYGHLLRTVPVYGKVYVSETDVCFRSLLPGVSTKMVLPMTDIEEVRASRGSRLTYHGLRLIVRGSEELDLEFGSSKSRDDFQKVVLSVLERLHSKEGFRPEPYQWGSNFEVELYKTRMEYSDSENREIQQYDNLIDIKFAEKKIEMARVRMFEDRLMAASGLDVPIILEDSPFFKTELRPSTSYNITLLTIGSRGDVQPYIALGKGLVKEGHNVTIATHAEFGDWIKTFGLGFKEIAGDPAELMSFMVTHNSMSVGFLKNAQQKFRSWISKLLTTSWEACQGSDILIESPSAMSGIHIGEALGIPYFRAFTMPWTRTRAYPHAFFVPEQKKGGSYNYLTHVLFENIFWKGISGQVNKWRVEELDLPKTNLYRLQQTRVPFLYNVSPAILPPSVDFPDWIKVTGYWFLDEGSGDYKPPEELVQFMKKASRDKKKIVYIGFGSIVVKDAKSLTKAVVSAVRRADVRCILNKGWSDRLDNKDKNEIEIELPPEIYNSGTIPHDWLFPRIDAAVHHGGSGTTGATMRAGIPTIIKPFFGDQFFYATRIEDLGAGIALKKLTAKTLGDALVKATHDLKIIDKAKRVSQQIKHEHGVLSAIESIYSELEYSRNLILIKDIHNQNYKRHHPVPSGVQTPAYDTDSDDYDDDEDDDESDKHDEEEEEEENSYDGYDGNGVNNSRSQNSSN